MLPEIALCSSLSQDAVVNERICASMQPCNYAWSPKSLRVDSVLLQNVL